MPESPVEGTVDGVCVVVGIWVVLGMVVVALVGIEVSSLVFLRQPAKRLRVRTRINAIEICFFMVYLLFYQFQV